MYNDYRNCSRDNWKYNYTGAELLPLAKKKFSTFFAAEAEARKRMSEYLMDMNMSQSDSKVTDAKNEIQNNGNLREQCAVFVHEFGRNPGREFILSLGDVTFFGLVPEPKTD